MRYLVQLDEPGRHPVWHNKHHAWTNHTGFATPLTRLQAERIAAKERSRVIAKARPERIITIIERAPTHTPVLNAIADEPKPQPATPHPFVGSDKKKACQMCGGTFYGSSGHWRKA